MSQPNCNPDSRGEPDSDEYFTDEFGEVITRREQREREAEEKRQDQERRDKIRDREQNRVEWLQNTNPVAFTISQDVYERASKHPESLTADDRALLLSRGDIQGRALVDAKGLLTQAERYRILGWPSPDEVTKNIRAATKDMETPLSTPLELVEKAERDGVSSLPQKAVLLVANKFQEGDEVELVLGTAKELDVNSLDIPGNNEAANLALQAEGLDLMKLGIIMMHHADGSLNKMDKTLAEAQGQPAAPLPLFQLMLTALQSGTPFDFGHPEQLLGAGAPGGSEPQMPGSFPRESEPEHSVTPKHIIQQEFLHKKQSPVPDADKYDTPPLPGPVQTFRVIDELADMIIGVKQDHDKGHINSEQFGRALNCIVDSMRGLSLRFKLSQEVDIPKREVQSEKMRQRRRICTPVPPFQFIPNPFGLRLSHDGRKLSQATKDSVLGDLPPHANQVPPWSPWSPDLPLRGMLKPLFIPAPSLEQLVAAVNEWTTKEEEARKKDIAEGREPPPFHETPPFWPSGYPQKRNFNMYLESVTETKEAQEWPEGDVNYASVKWDAMPASEHAVYDKLCEERRRMAWMDSLNKYTNVTGYWK
ncbi:hypothetical protein Sste5346_010019 [Sporothrix stenoceras]|uniref:Uncharacterized protein n=1 Tax=Sporothrix stenoceras TaxID=5173 RepID=A0ABR3YID6_9PEZI